MESKLEENDKSNRIVVNEIKNRLLNRLEYLENIDDMQLKNLISEEIREYSNKKYISIKEKLDIGKEVFHSMRRLDIVQEIMDDPEVTEIMINGMDAIFIEKKGKITRLDKCFDSEATLNNIIQQIVASCNRIINESSPIVDARLEDGSRVNVVLNPIAINGPILTIRRFPKKPFIMEDLINKESIDEETAEFLRKLVVAGYNIIVSGGTGSGKTTFLNSLSGFIPKDERIITIEDSAELQIQGIENLVKLETKNANVEGCKSITIRDLIKTSLRMRPSRIIVGEVRGEEAFDMICSAMNCGHDGSMSTVHANSAGDTLARLETMILMAADIPVNSIRQQIRSGVDIIVHLGRLRDKSRHVLEIVEIVTENEKTINTLYEFVENDCINGKIKGSLVKRGELINDKKLKAAGLFE